jgi:hypothetical protein
MDSTALKALIGEIRGTTATLAGAEQKVAAFTAELAGKKPVAPVQVCALSKAIPRPKRGSSGWIPANR